MKQAFSCRAFIGGLLIIFFLLAPWLTDSRYYLHILIMTFFFGYLATSWNLLGGYAGQHSFGHAAFVGIGAYSSSMLFVHTGLSPWIGMWIGAFLAGIVALVWGYLSFRYGLRGPYFLLVTIAFSEVLVYLALNIRAVGGASGINIPLMGESLGYFQFQGKAPYYYIIMTMTAAGIGISYLVQRSRMGYYFIAIRENEEAAQSLGVNPTRYKLYATVLSAALSALGGTFYAQYILFIDPSSILSLGLSIEIVIYAIVGGVGTILGPLLGAIFLVPVAEATRIFFAAQTGGIHLILYGLILVLSIILMPGGIARRLLRNSSTYHKE